MVEQDRSTVGDAADAPAVEVGGGEYGRVKRRTQREIVWHRFKRHRLALVGGVVLLLIFAVSVAAPVLAPYEYDGIDYRAINRGPSADHPMGADNLGRDELTRVLYGGRVSLMVGLGVGVFSTLIGAVVGIISGYYGRYVDVGAMGFTDFVLTLPLIPLMLVLGSIFKFTPLAITAVLALLLWRQIARIVRGQVLSIREQEYVQAAKAIGVSGARIMLRHVLPNVVGVMVVQATLMTAEAILIESALSYLGLGIQPPTPSWGNMLEDARTTMTQQWWLTWFPGLMIVLTVLSVNFLGDGLRDALDPRAVE